MVSQKGLCKATSSKDIDSICKGVEFLVRMQQDTLLNKLINDILQIQSAELLKSLVCQHFAHYNISEPVKQLLRARINQLVPIVQAGEPTADWHQPTAVLPEHPEVEAFLRGPEKSFLYKKFNARCHAEKFEKDYFIEKGNAVIKVMGSRYDTVVQIIKVPADRKNYDEAMQKYNQRCSELQSLQTRLGIKSA